MLAPRARQPAAPPPSFMMRRGARLALLLALALGLPGARLVQGILFQTKREQLERFKDFYLRILVYLVIYDSR